MKFAAPFTLLALASVAIGAAMPQKSVIVSYPDSTPDSIVDQAMDAIKEAGGLITHEYKLIKGFAAKAPAKVLEQVQTWGNDYQAVIEEDQMVTTSS
ncbi:hypothetical protein BGZ60DRAFT_472438 [Tricladium varicosporioides]|nr:hypothetical protein BGZ60DRAFT_472438 [Hymenoscyphus varicosporioides]